MTWHELFTQAIRDFGDTPGATLEQDLIDQHHAHPAAVELAIIKITKAYQAGKINSPWGALKAEVAKQIKVRSSTSTNTGRTQAERNAEQWIRAAGVHYDRWPEVEDELFGPLGKLHPWHTDTRPRDRMLGLWHELRPAGEQTEAEAIERADQWKRTNPLSRDYQPTATAGGAAA